MKVTLAPVESLVLSQAAEQLKLNGEEVIELSQKDLQGNSEASIESILANTDSLVVNLPFATEFVQSLVRLHRAKPEALEGKLLVGISSVVTWGKTTGETVTDADESRRIPIPGALPLLELERLLMTCGNSHIICHGILYGAGECNRGLKQVFDKAFNESTATIYGKGDNKLPLVHVKDVVKFIDLVLSSKLSKRYSVVVDEVENTLEEVTGSIAEAFGAEIKRASHDEVIFMENAADIEHLFLDVQMECTKVDDYVFQFSSGLVSEMRSMAAEYTEALSYSPRAYFLMGPPCAGKTYFAKGLCEKYGLEYISKEQVELLQKESVEKETESSEDNAEKEKESISVATAFKKIMSKPVIENKGYVLDGFPATIQEAYELFPNPAFKEREERERREEKEKKEAKANKDTKGGEKDEAAAANEEEKEEEKEKVQKLLYPNLAVYVKADDPVLQERAGTETADFNGRYSTFKKSSEEDKKNFLDQLKKLDEANARAKEAAAAAAAAAEQEDVKEKTEEEEQEEKEGRERIDEIAQTSSLTAYLTLMGSKYMDVDNNRKEVLPVVAVAKNEQQSQEGEGEGKPPAESAEAEEEFSPLQHLMDRIEGKVVAEDKDVSAESKAEDMEDKEKEEKQEADTKDKEEAEEPEVAPEPETTEQVETKVPDISQVEDLESLVKPVKAYLASQLAPAISKGFIKLIEEKPENPIKFLGEFLIEQSNAK